MASGARKAGDAALSALLPWLLAGGAILAAFYLLRKAIEDAGGVDGLLSKWLGLGPGKPIAREEHGQQDMTGQDHESGGVGSSAVTGHFQIGNGDTLQITAHPLGFYDSVEIPFALVNSSSERQQVEVQIHVYEDFAISDDQQTWVDTVTVDGASSALVYAQVNLTAARLPFTRPQLFLDLTVAGVHQDRKEHVQTS